MNPKDSSKPTDSPPFHASRFEERDVEQSIIRRFEAQVEAFADRPALSGSGRLLTFHALNTAANRISALLLEHLSDRDTVVAFHLDDRVDAVITLLGILKSGKSYLALDSASPPARLQDILRDAETNLIITRASTASAVHEIAAPLGMRVLTLEQAEQHPAQHNPGIYAGPGDLAALFYTSGSTGEPKAIAWSHRNILNNLSSG